MSPKQFYEALAAAYRQGPEAVGDVIKQAGRTLNRNTIDQVAVALRQAGDAAGARQLARTFTDTKGGRVAEKAKAALEGGNTLVGPGPTQSESLLKSPKQRPQAAAKESGPLPEPPPGPIEETIASNLPEGEAGSSVSIESTGSKSRKPVLGDDSIVNTVEGEPGISLKDQNADSRVSGMETQGETAAKDADANQKELDFESTGDPEIDAAMLQAKKDGGVTSPDGTFISNAEIDEMAARQKPIIFDKARERGLLDADNNITTPEQRAAFADDNQFRSPEPPPREPAPYSQNDVNPIPVDNVGQTGRVMDARTTDAPGMEIDPTSTFAPYIDPRSVDMKRLRDLGLGEQSAALSVPGSSMEQTARFGVNGPRPLDLSGFDPMARYDPSLEPISSTQPLPVNSPSYIEPSTKLPSPAPLQGPPLPPGFDGRTMVGPPPPPQAGSFSQLPNGVTGPPSQPAGSGARPFVGPPVPPGYAPPIGPPLPPGYTPPPATSRLVPETGLDEFGPALANEGQNFSPLKTQQFGPPPPPNTMGAREPFGPQYPEKGPLRDSLETIRREAAAKKAAGEVNVDTKEPPAKGTIGGKLGKYVGLPLGGLAVTAAGYQAVDSVQDFQDEVSRRQMESQSIEDMYRQIEGFGRERTPMLNAGQPQPNILRQGAMENFKDDMRIQDPVQDDVLPDPPKTIKKKKNLKDTI
tara:strand:- start:32324 stop:34408 length:2085 start_codon:yes stop_codon:yes gene_type:complete